VLNSF